MPEASSSRSRQRVGNREVSRQSATPEVGDRRLLREQGPRTRAGSGPGPAIPDRLGQVAGGILAEPRVAAGDPVPGEVRRGQDAAAAAPGIRSPSMPAGPRTPSSGRRRTTRRTSVSRPGQCGQRRLGRVDRQHGDPPAPDPPLDRQQRAGSPRPAGWSTPPPSGGGPRDRPAWCRAAGSGPAAGRSRPSCIAWGIFWKVP